MSFFPWVYSWQVSHYCSSEHGRSMHFHPRPQFQKAFKAHGSVITEDLPWFQWFHLWWMWVHPIVTSSISVLWPGSCQSLDVLLVCTIEWRQGSSVTTCLNTAIFVETRGWSLSLGSWWREGSESLFSSFQHFWLSLSLSPFTHALSRVHSTLFIYSWTLAYHKSTDFV